MLVFKTGNLFDSECTTLVNTVNTTGAMGAGIALQFKNKYPKMFKWYKGMCDNNNLITGKVYLYSGTPNILLFPTKAAWWKKSEHSYIDAGLRDFADAYCEFGITSIAFPKLGCKNGGLNWIDVKPLMVKYLNDLPIYIEIYE